MEKVWEGKGRGLAALIVALMLLVGTASAGEKDGLMTPSGLSARTFTEKAVQIAEEAAGSEARGLALVIFSDQGILHAQGFGRADAAGEKPVLPRETGFEYGSVSKTLVWLSLLQLQEEGRLSLKEDISRCLPADFYQSLRLKWPITLLDLMNHRAGFEEYPLDMIVPEGAEPMTLERALLQALPVQRFRPGTVSAYSNFGCALAACAAERVSGLPFEDYLKRRFFEPLSMASCGVNADRAPGGMAQGSAADGTGGFLPVAPSRVLLYPAGGVRGTAEDLARLGIALLARDQRIFAKESTFDLLYQDSFAPYPGGDGMAHGLFTMNAEGGRGYQHAGNTDGFTAQLSLAPAHRIGFVLLSNTAYTNAVGSALNHLLMGPAARPQNLPDEETQPQSGYYVSPRNAFSLPYYSLLSYVNAYHLEADGDQPSLTSALMRIAGFFGADDLRLVATRRQGGLYRVVNRPEMVENLYLETRDGQIQSLWSDGSQLVPLAQTPKKSYPLILGAALAMLLLMLGFLLSALIHSAARIIRRLRGRERKPLAPYLLRLSGAFISLVYLAGLGFIGGQESPARAALNGYTAALAAGSIAALALILYYGLRSGKRPSEGFGFLRPAAALALLMALLLYWGQYRLI